MGLGNTLINTSGGTFARSASVLTTSTKDSLLIVVSYCVSFLSTSDFFSILSLLYRTCNAIICLVFAADNKKLINILAVRSHVTG